MVAVGICEKVSLFGFGKSGEAKHHYPRNQKGELWCIIFYNLFDNYYFVPNTIMDIPKTAIASFFAHFHRQKSV